jgi:serine/threonine protein phosphatase PrpC
LNMAFLRGLRGLAGRLFEGRLGARRGLHSVEQPGLEIGWATAVGAVRSHNEDAAFVLTSARAGDDATPVFGFFGIADGMGGHRAGEIASTVAVSTAAHHVLSRFYLPALVGHQRDGGEPTLTDILVEAVKAANRAVTAEVAGGGTTLTCALTVAERAYIAHVGDSRAYVVGNSGFEQITHDHSLVDRLVELGELDPDKAVDHPQRNVLYRAVGQSNSLDVDTHVRTIPRGSQLCLCSDGLWSQVSDSVMLEVISAAPSLQAACEELVAKADEAGGHDNSTVILVGQMPQ